MNLEDIVLNGIRGTEKQLACGFLHIYLELKRVKLIAAETNMVFLWGFRVSSLRQGYQTSTGKYGALVRYYTCVPCVNGSFWLAGNVSCWLLELLFPHLYDLPVVSVVYDGSMKTFGKDFEVIPGCLF